MVGRDDDEAVAGEVLGWKVFWKRMPFEPCEKAMSGKGASSASATSRTATPLGYPFRG